MPPIALTSLTKPCSLTTTIPSSLRPDEVADGHLDRPQAAGVVLAGERARMALRVDVQAVDESRVAATREGVPALLGQRHVDHVARDREERGVAGHGVHAQDHERVRPEAPAPGAGIAADEQDVEAPVGQRPGPRVGLGVGVGTGVGAAVVPGRGVGVGRGTGVGLGASVSSGISAKPSSSVVVGCREDGFDGVAGRHHLGADDEVRRTRSAPGAGRA